MFPIKLLSLNWRIIAIVALCGVICGGWYLFLTEKEKHAQTTALLSMAEANVDTLTIQGEVVEIIDTTEVIKYATEWKTVIKADTLIEIKCDTLLMTITSSGYVEIDTTIAGRLDFWGKIYYPTGLSVFNFKLHPQEIVKKNFYASLGIGYTRKEAVYAVADVNYRRVGLGALFRQDEIGLHLKVNF